MPQITGPKNTTTVRLADVSFWLQDEVVMV